MEVDLLLGVLGEAGCILAHANRRIVILVLSNLLLYSCDQLKELWE